MKTLDKLESENTEGFRNPSDTEIIIQQIKRDKDNEQDLSTLFHEYEKELSRKG